MPAILPQLAASIVKETRIILRDKEALAILFVLPAVFVLIMSLALQDAFNQQAGIRFTMTIVNQDADTVGNQLAKSFTEDSSFTVTLIEGEEAKNTDIEKLRAGVIEGQSQFAIIVPEKTTSTALKRAELHASGKAVKGDLAAIRFFADPTLRADHRRIVTASLNAALQQVEAEFVYRQFSEFARRAGRPLKSEKTSGKGGIELFAEVPDPFAAAKDGNILPSPTSVQQNAPGWGLLSMFFLVIPLSGALVRERQEGSLVRLQTMAVPTWMLLAGKMAPYFIINQIQIVVILLEGMYLLPVLGGDRLELGPHPEAIIPLSVAISIAAIGYGLMVAAFCRTAEQGTVFGATTILIMGALGGIMVPKIVMPATMQAFTAISPMSWGLEGFLAIFVRGAGVTGVVHESAVMLLFGIICLAIGILRFQYRLHHN